MCLDAEQGTLEQVLRAITVQLVQQVTYFFVTAFRDSLQEVFRLKGKKVVLDLKSASP